MYDVVDRFLNSRGKDWNADLLKQYGGLQDEENARRADALRTRPAKTRPSLPLADYAGAYADPLVGETLVRKRATRGHRTSASCSRSGAAQTGASPATRPRRADSIGAADPREDSRDRLNSYRSAGGFDPSRPLQRC